MGLEDFYSLLKGTSFLGDMFVFGGVNFHGPSSGLKQILNFLNRFIRMAWSGLGP